MDDSKRHHRVSQIIEVALSTPINDRHAVIKEMCNGDTELVSEVNSLLEQETLASKLLEKPIFKAQSILELDTNVIGFGDINISGFTLKKVLGQGSSSIVYLAQQNDPHREVAIKVLRPLSGTEHAASRIRAEAHLLARLAHPAIARIYQVGIIESQLHSQPFIVMEYVKGDSLQVILKEHDVSFDQRLQLVLSLCEIIEYAHQQGVVHRDIKPSNILVSVDENNGQLVPMVIDFGIAKIIHGEAIPIDVQTICPEYFGTLRYMSPERRDGYSTGDSISSDIYSIGVLARELLDGKIRITESKASSYSNDAESISSLSDPLNEVLCRMTHSDPEKRFVTVHEASESLRLAAFANYRKPVLRKIGSGIRSIRKTYASRGVVAACLLMTAFAIPGFMVLNQGVETSVDQIDDNESGTNFVANGSDDQRGHIERTKQRFNALNGSMTVAIGASNISGSDNIDERTKILKARTVLISQHAKEGYHQEADRLIQLTENEFQDLYSFPIYLVKGYLVAKAYALSLSGKHYLAIDVLMQAKELIVLDDDLMSYVADSWRAVAHGIQGCGDFTTARQMYQELIDHPAFHEISWAVQSNTLACSAGLYWIEKDYGMAEQMFRSIINSAPAFPTEKEDLIIADKQSSLGVVLTTQGKYVEAEVQFNLAINRAIFYLEPSDQLISRIYRNLAMCHLRSGKFEESIYIMLPIRNIWAAMPDGWRFNLAEADFILGSASLGLGEPEHALAYLLESKRECLSFDGASAERLLPKIENALGEALCLLGDTEKGRYLMDASSIPMREFFGDESYWVLKAAERSITHADCN